MRGVMAPEDVLRLAKEREVSACRFYSDMMHRTEAEYVWDLLSKLRDDEYQHVVKIEKLLDEVRGRR